MDSLTKRNMNVIVDGLKQQRSVNIEQDEKIKQLEAELHAMKTLVNDINARYWTDKANNGIGATT